MQIIMFFFASAEIIVLSTVRRIFDSISRFNLIYITMPLDGDIYLRIFRKGNTNGTPVSECKRRSSIRSGEIRDHGLICEHLAHPVLDQISVSFGEIKCCGFTVTGIEV